MDPCWPEQLQSDRTKVIDELVKGCDFANQLKSFLTDCVGDDGSMIAEDLVLRILNSFTSSLSILNGVESDAVSQFPATTQAVSPCSDGRKAEDSDDSSKNTSTRKDRRGCYKRRKTTHSWIRESHVLVDDGHAWRKYGQKVILNATYPRNYFRCTHKFDQGCQATKQVQRVEKEPPKYRTTYYGHHTCKNFVKASDLFLDATDTSMLLSFNGSGNGHNQHLTHKQDTPFLSSFQSIKQEYNKNEMAVDHLNHNQSSSSDYINVSPEDGLSAFDSAAADVISGVNSCCSTTTSTHHSLDIDMIVSSVDNILGDDDWSLHFDG